MGMTTTLRPYQTEARYQCSVSNCNRKSAKCEYCETHYAQIKHNGEIRHLRTEPNEYRIENGVVYISLYDRYHKKINEECLIDECDIPIIEGKRIVLSRYKNQKRIIVRDKSIGQNHRIHRLIMNPPKGMDVDHINRNMLDNRRCNLRICDRSHNNMNRMKRGYSLHSQNKNYSVEIKSGTRRIRIHGIKEESEAIKIRRKLEIYVFGEYAVNRVEN